MALSRILRQVGTYLLYFTCCYMGNWISTSGVQTRNLFSHAAVKTTCEKFYLRYRKTKSRATTSAYSLLVGTRIIYEWVPSFHIQ